jgi:hypothetical protein
MTSTDASRMILAESAGMPDLARIAGHVSAELSRGRQVPRDMLSWLVREAGLRGVFDAVQRKHGTDVVRDAILLLERETLVGQGQGQG